MNCNKVNIKKGSTGDDVKELQTYMKYLGLYKAEIDGICGDLTVTAIKALQKRYSVTVDGIFGKKTCKACGINGQDISNSIQAISRETFIDMYQRYADYVEKNNKAPKICYVDYETKYRYITVDKLKEMKTRFDAFVKSNGRDPNSVYINLPTSESVNDNDFVAKFKNAVGNFTTFIEAYNLIKGRGYIGYNNDIYDQETALKRLKNKSGLNCSDSCQLMYALAESMGLTVRYRHVICKSGTGHIQLDVKYPSSASNYTTIDPAAALSTGSKYAFGKVWCANARVISYNDGWLMSDDGKT